MYKILFSLSLFLVIACNNGIYNEKHLYLDKSSKVKVYNSLDDAIGNSVITQYWYCTACTTDTLTKGALMFQVSVDTTNQNVRPFYVDVSDKKGYIRVYYSPTNVYKLYTYNGKYRNAGLKATCTSCRSIHTVNKTK